MNKFVLRQSVLLFLTAVIWGVAFVAQSAGMEYVGPFTYNGVRCILGGLVLIPCIALLDRMQQTSQDKDSLIRQDSITREKKDNSWSDRGLLMGGICCGVILFAASNFQQFGIQYTSVGKAGFITAMYILLVPVMGLFIHKKVGFKVWVGVAFAVCGLYLGERGYDGINLCVYLFSAYIGNRLFFTEGGWCEDVVYSVLGVRYLISRVCLFI